MPSNTMTSLVLSTAVATTTVAGSQLWQQLSPSSPGFSTSAESCLLTKPDLPGSGWLEPWDPDPTAPAGVTPPPTKEEWKGQHDARAVFDKMIAQFETMSDADFKDFIIMLAQFMPAAGGPNPGANPGSRPSIPTVDDQGGAGEFQKDFQEQLRKGTVTKSNFLKLVKQYRSRMLDCASTSFSRSTSGPADPGAGANALPKVFVDNISIDLTVFSDEAIDQLRATTDAFRAGTGDEGKVQEVMVRFQKKIKENDAAYMQTLQKEKSDLINLPERDASSQQRIAEIDRTLARIAANEAAVKSDIVANSSGGVRLAVKTIQDGNEMLIISAQVRVGNALFIFTRGATGTFAANALAESDDLIQLLIKRMDPFDQ